MCIRDSTQGKQEALSGPLWYFALVLLLRWYGRNCQGVRRHAIVWDLSAFWSGSSSALRFVDVAEGGTGRRPHARPEAAAAAGEAGRFNAVQKLLTAQAGKRIARITPRPSAE